MAEGFWNRLTGSKDTAGGNQEVDVAEQVIYSEKLLDDYYERAQDWRELAKKNEDYRYNNQLDDEIREQLKNLNQSPASFNVIHPNVELAKQFLTHRDPQFQASAREDSDVQMSRAATMVMSYIWDNSDGNIQFAQSTDDFYVRGPGVLFAYVDPNADAGRGEVFIRSVDPFKVYIDPNSQDPYARDAAHIIISDTMTAEQVQDNYSWFDENIMDKVVSATYDDRRPVMDRNHPENPDIGRVKQDVETEYYEVIDRYSKVHVPRFHVMETDSGREFMLTKDQFDGYKSETAIIVNTADGREVVTDPKAVEELLGVFEQTGGVFHYIERQIPNMQGGMQVVPEMAAGEPGPEAIPNSRTELEITTKGDVFDEIAVFNKIKVNRVKRTLSVGKVLITEETLEISEYPIVPAFNNHSRNPYPLSDVYFVRGLQDALNKTMSDIMAHLANSKATRVLVPRGSDRDEIETVFRKSGVSIAEYDPDIGTPVTLSPTPLPSEVYHMSDRIEKKVQDQFGIYGVSAGDPSNLPRTFNATLLMDENAQRRMGPKIKTLYGQLNVLANVVLQYAQQTYDKRKLERILQPNFEQLPIEIDSQAFFSFKEEVLEKFNDWGIAKFDVKIVSGSTLPNNRWARMEYYIKLYQMGLIDDVTVLRNSDISEVEEVLNRKSQLAQAKQIIEQQEEIIKNQKGDMQTMQRETVNAKQQKELEKTKSKLKELEVRAEKDLELFSNRLDDSLKERKQARGASGGGESSPGALG